MDLRAAIQSDITLHPNERKLIPAGFTIEIPEGFEGQVRPRSGLALKNGITLLNSPGTIDSDYRGEVGIIMVNLGAEDFVITPGARIAQLVIAPVARAILSHAEALDQTERGAGGFGHTGHR